MFFHCQITCCLTGYLLFAVTLLKASTFLSSKLIKKLLKTKIFYTFPYHQAQTKSRDFSLQNKMKETLSTNQFNFFLNSNPADYF